jgi:hypothetical protein
LVREKSAFFLKNREKNDKNQKKAPQSPRPQDKEPDLVFFCHYVIFCVEQQGKKFLEAIKHF